MHTYGRGIDNEIEGMIAQGAPWNGFSAGNTGERFGCRFSTRTDVDRSSRSCKRECRGACRTTSAKNQRTAALDYQFVEQSAEDAEIIRIAAEERTISTDHHGVDGT